MKPNLFYTLLLLIAIQLSVKAQKYQLESPDKSIIVSLNIGKEITYNVQQNGKSLIQESAIGLETDKNKIGWRVSKKTISSVQNVLKPVVWVKTETIDNHYNAIVLKFSNGLSLEWRAFNNGVAWHWLSDLKGSYKVLSETASFQFASGAKSLFPKEDQFFSHNEREYKPFNVNDLDSTKLASLPTLFDVDSTKIILTESDLWDYAGMWIRGGGNGKINGVFPHHPKEKKVTSDRDEQVTKYDTYIADLNGAKSFPWRVLMINTADKDILSNQLVYQLAKPATGDYSWVKPGKVQWDWWHYNNLYGVDFKAGINNDTYKYYIDFASKYHLEYVLLDEGWCDTRDLMKQSPGIDVEELARYAKSKNVDLLLWTSWLVLDKQLDQALDVFEKWGIKGIKVDFMQRDDQDMVNYYEKVSKAAAKRKLMVDFHGAFKPTGWNRTYPNVMTSEGVLGNEISKFVGSITPDHTTTIPFIRMAAGPMDFTPGGMLNVQKNAFAGVPSEPMTLGTRCNQLAMYVVFESPLQMLCDIPTHYYKEPEAMEFLKEVPSVWKNTVPLQAKVGDYVAVARQAKNNDWYIGAMTDWTARDLNLDLSFLGDGKYKMMVWKDGVNADKNAKDFKQETIEVDKNTKLTIKMTTGGGYVARLVKI
ncbi:glycoside hydrolase family 97 protein [Pedobacter fastidiosus]|uniref:Glycoside hydrolase family 97 protein n=1 Tax=Pedobacter fastidiosus TaxID=2765361 RepID=A0ABR7KXL6_9SPHI|nr:glycoside hydrolase family 97 protein [Pedobacter fastidiosus]MBC6112864.1 glycoside hydrolase family 97 protein [Pedobacter fastidiosus]